MHRAGLETMLMNYYRNIDRTKIQFDFLTHRPYKSDYDDEILSLGGRMYYAPRLYPQNYIQYFRWMDKFFEEHLEYQIMHSHIDSMSYLPLLAAKRANVPVRIAHSHNTSIDRDLKYPLKQLFRTRITKVANEYCACGEEAGKFLFGNRDFKVIPNAIETERFIYEEIASIAKDYGTAAKRAVNAGFDVVEIHAGHSYLISQFLSPTTNDRTDEFGGSAENRARFCRMVIDEVRKAVGPRVPISLRLSVDELPNLTIKTGVDATVAEIKKYTPDLVVNATGSVPLLPPIEGLHDNLGKKDASVYSIKDMIADVKNYPEDMTGKKVVVVGGGAVGLDVVEFFAPRGAETTIIEMMPVIGNGLDASSTSSMKECMEKHHVRQMTNTALQKVNAHSFLVKYDGKEEELDRKSVV